MKIKNGTLFIGKKNLDNIQMGKKGLNNIQIGVIYEYKEYIIFIYIENKNQKKE